ncbi:hypothetical protein [Streptomyces sp. NPDC092370]|uniref:hypothetical protein n=1 Tax=Streptomyces sp. NPDC092370 TaxID=3366016 RepID=UPI003819E12C
MRGAPRRVAVRRDHVAWDTDLVRYGQGDARDATTVFELRDVDEVRTALVRDADETPWAKAGDHSSASERVDACTLGQPPGLEGCHRRSAR